VLTARSRRWMSSAPLALIVIAAGTAAAQDPSPEPLSFYPVEPCRVFDTRHGDQGGGLVTTNGTAVRSFQVRGTVPGSNCNIPATARAIIFNVVVVAQPYAGHLTLYPSNVPTPPTSTLNFPPNLTVANGGVVKINTAATLDLTAMVALGGSPSGAVVQLVLDITGYFAP
jgi:hypothetical protein